MNHSFNNKITYFSKDEIKGVDIPEKFTFPFYYEPNPLTKIAVSQLQSYLENEFRSEHNFGLNKNHSGLVIGKMFGILVTQDSEGKLGYLSAFSGKLAGTNAHEKFVPPVFDMLTENSFFKKEEEILNQFNFEIEKLESDEEFIQLKFDFEKYSQESIDEISAFKSWIKTNKTERKKIRENIQNESSEKELIRQSNLDQFKLKILKESWEDVLNSFKQRINEFEEKIEGLKKIRREKSATLQNQLFEQYSFLNKNGETKSLGSIFSETVYEKPPAGAGECATPKLLQFAFSNNLKPVSFAEFWWGDSPKSEVRKHKYIYPACNGKCRPILKHMLNGIPLEENMLLKNLGEGKELKIVYEDDSFIIVNKPAELLSVPGIEIHDSVYTRLQDILDVEPLIIHRLDMSTSGLLVVAKTKEIHKNIQHQFLKRTVKKRYTALLSKAIEGKNGEINLPLRGDFDDRPRQLVCFEHGKKAITKWEVIEKTQTTTKVHFWPLTGRTHQLRMHAAHELGLNAPIVGDDLYGTVADRLHLHAAYLEFIHPKTKEVVQFEVKEDF
ncbi:RluA family pseudouridine synthase [Moheibacter sediminis]|uniref:tRNA pseudouridine32 synthase / 23S rRNA pseudouridine746 synthase n=1 Tax=Moheibacter sediminis TaxID=1434700 RepID=A0A1W2C5W4_9FLAO|nr:RluA family pseudouridine synthase [Moheibacter sediminis]SMC80078.1 tRNA pseudouridine32 synthase / 23S rRNA pseudouridine746 synthase [Moheibacter sediminis]